MTLDLDWDDGQQAIAGSVAAFCAERFDDEAGRQLAGEFPAALWRALAELGVFGVAAPEGEGGASELVAAVEPLGRATFPGPLAATFLAMQVLDEPERDRVAMGELIVAAGEPPLLPFAPCAQVFLEVEGDRVFRARLVGRVETVRVLGGEPWGRAPCVRERELPGAARGLLLSQLVVSAQLAAMGAKLVEDAARYAGDRRQFGRPIGAFQAVAHPLADSTIALTSASALTRAAACRFDAGEMERAEFLAAAAWSSASRAAVEASYLCHQVFGAIGITIEGPAFRLSRRIRQLASQPPGAARARARVSRALGLAGGVAA